MSPLGQKPRAFLHLGDQASSSPLVQEERGRSRADRPPDGAVPLRRRRAHSQEWRSGAYIQSENSWFKLSFWWTLCFLSMSRALQAWRTCLWPQEFLRQRARPSIKRFLPGCSKVTNQTLALKVNAPYTPINGEGGSLNPDGIIISLQVIFGYFLCSHMCDLFLNIEFWFVCTIKRIYLQWIEHEEWIVLQGYNQSGTDTLGTLLMCSSRAESLSSGPLWAKPLNQEPSNPGGGPGFHQRGLKTHHQHTGALTQPVDTKLHFLSALFLAMDVWMCVLFFNFLIESFTWEAKKVKVGENLGPLSHAVQSGGPRNGKNAQMFLPFACLPLHMLSSLI